MPAQSSVPRSTAVSVTGVPCPEHPAKPGFLPVQGENRMQLGPNCSLPPLRAAELARARAGTNEDFLERLLSRK